MTLPCLKTSFNPVLPNTRGPLPSHSKNCVVRSTPLFFTAAEAVLCSEILRSQNNPLGPIVAGVNWNNLLAAMMLFRDQLGFKSHMYACQI